jgi:hypothetical protein
MVYIPAERGMHWTDEALVDEQPFGKPVYWNVSGAVPPITIIDRTVITPTVTAEGRAVNEVIRGSGCTVTVRFDEAATPNESATLTWMVNVPGPVGVHRREAASVEAHPGGRPS